jgi:hypothetical protein
MHFLSWKGAEDMSHQTDQQNAIEAVRQQNRREGKCEDCGGSGVVANMRAIDQTGDPHVNRRCARCGGSGLPVVTATSGTCDRSMASGAMLSPPDDLASLRAQVQALQQELQQSRAETEGADALTEKKVREIEVVWQQMLKHKRGAEAAAAEIAHLRSLPQQFRDCAFVSRLEAGRIRSIVKEPTAAEERCNARAEVWDKAADEIEAALTSAPEGTT